MPSAGKEGLQGFSFRCHRRSLLSPSPPIEYVGKRGLAKGERGQKGRLKTCGEERKRPIFFIEEREEKKLLGPNHSHPSPLFALFLPLRLAQEGEREEERERSRGGEVRRRGGDERRGPTERRGRTRRRHKSGRSWPSPLDLSSSYSSLASAMSLAYQNRSSLISKLRHPSPFLLPLIFTTFFLFFVYVPSLFLYTYSLGPLAFLPPFFTFEEKWRNLAGGKREAETFIPRLNFDGGK
jgi:hypothetical protein